MTPAYFETRFRLKNLFSDWSKEFAIITAYATTGENWMPEQNLAADRSLEIELQQMI